MVYEVYSWYFKWIVKVVAELLGQFSRAFSDMGVKCLLQEPLCFNFHFHSVCKYLGHSFRDAYPSRWFSDTGDLLSRFSMKVPYMNSTYFFFGGEWEGWGVVNIFVCLLFVSHAIACATLSFYPLQNISLFLHFRLSDCPKHQKYAGQLYIDGIWHRPFLHPKLSRSKVDTQYMRR